MAERVRVRDITNEEGNRLLRIVRRSSGSVVTWRRAQMVLLSAQGMDVPAIAKVTFTSHDRVRDVRHNFNLDGFDALLIGSATTMEPTRITGSSPMPARASVCDRPSASEANTAAAAPQITSRMGMAGSALRTERRKSHRELAKVEPPPDPDALPRVPEEAAGEETPCTQHEDGPWSKGVGHLASSHGGGRDGQDEQRHRDDRPDEVTATPLGSQPVHDGRW